MRCGHHVQHIEQRMIGIAHRLFFEHIDRHHAGLSCTPGGDKDMFRRHLRRASQLHDLCQFGCIQRW
jgi:hypothetical protein